MPRGGVRPGAGRPPGRRLDELREKIEKEFPGYNPIIALLKLADSTITVKKDGIEEQVPDKQMQFQCHKEVAKYLLPTLRAIELTGEDGKDIIPTLSDAELIARLNTIFKSSDKD